MADSRRAAGNRRPGPRGRDGRAIRGHRTGAAVPSAEHFRRLERLYLAAPTNDYYRPTIRIDDGRVVQAGRRLFVAESTVRDADGREIGRGSGSFIRSGIALGPDVGYA